jgi:hypothetical protein
VVFLRILVLLLCWQHAGWHAALKVSAANPPCPVSPVVDIRAHSPIGVSI